MMDEEATDLANGTCIMVQNPYYDGSLRDPQGQFGNDHMLEKITVKAGTSAAAAVEGLKNGTFDIIDPRAELTPFLAYLNSTANADWSEVGLAPEWGHQALYINHFSPYWGMNPADPRLLYPGEYDDFPFEHHLLISISIFFGILCIIIFQIIRYRKR
jgi:ABC-type transport system substrate-binding protein